MSICAFISNPIDKSEIGLYIPFASESFFKNTWLIGAQELQLKWISLFSNGVDVTKEELPLIIKEIKKLKIWAKNNLLQEDYEQIVARINFIEKELPKLFLRKETLVFIG